MRTYREEPPRTIPGGKVVDTTSCDICGCVSKNDKWGGSAYDVRDTYVEMTTGKSYPDGGGFTETRRFDICPECFRTKLIPALRALGATPTITESDT